MTFVDERILRKQQFCWGGTKERQKEKVKEIRFEGYDQEFLYPITKAEEIHDLKYLLCSKPERIIFAIHEI